MSFLDTAYSAQEQSLMNSSTTGGQQSPLNASALGALRTKATGTSGGSVPMSGIGAALGATPYGALLGGVADAIGQGPPSQTANSGAGPNSAKYGDKYMSALTNSSKAGAFNVVSGSARVEAQSAATSQDTSPLDWKKVALMGGALLVFVFVWKMLKH